MSTFMKEQRYLVIKLKDLLAINCTPEEQHMLSRLCAKVEAHRLARGKPRLECVVVESDWRCYQQTWGAVRAEHDQNQKDKHCAEHGHTWRKAMSYLGSRCTCCGLWKD